MIFNFLTYAICDQILILNKKIRNNVKKKEWEKIREEINKFVGDPI